MQAYREPLELVGLPYKRGGNIPEVGFDCFTLLAYVRWNFYHRSTPGEIPARKMSAAAACALGIRRALGHRERLGGEWVAMEAPREGCAVALGRSRLGRLHHCGVWVGQGFGDSGVLHALEGVGVVWTPGLRIIDLYSRVEFYECRA